ncbi:MAG: homeodomain mating type protein alpha2 [Paramarteilia canceri]
MMSDPDFSLPSVYITDPEYMAQKSLLNSNLKSSSNELPFEYCLYRNDDNNKMDFFDNNGSDFIKDYMNEPRKRPRFDKSQIQVLEDLFSDKKDSPYLSREECQTLSKDSNLSTLQIRKWFANKRARSKAGLTD